MDEILMEHVIDLLRSISSICVSFSNLVDDESIGEKFWELHLKTDDIIALAKKVSA
jgi:hypothetical protein